jgi:hypothetical protein
MADRDIYPGFSPEKRRMKRAEHRQRYHTPAPGEADYSIGDKNLCSSTKFFILDGFESARSEGF